MYKPVITDMKTHMEKSVEDLRKEYQRIRTGRASITLLDDVKVDYYGTPSSLSQVANLAIPEPRTITITPWESNMIGPIEKAILNANLGLTPGNDGKLIRLNLPPLTEERRKDIVKGMKKIDEEHKIAVRNIRRKAIDDLKKMEKDKAISEDELKKAEKEVQTVTDGVIAKLEEILTHKEKEVMEV